MHACQTKTFKDVDAIQSSCYAKWLTRSINATSIEKEELASFLVSKRGEASWQMNVKIVIIRHLFPASSAATPQHVCFKTFRNLYHTERRMGEGSLSAYGLRMLRHQHCAILFSTLNSIWQVITSRMLTSMNTVCGQVFEKRPRAHYVVRQLAWSLLRKNCLIMR